MKKSNCQIKLDGLPDEFFGGLLTYLLKSTKSFGPFASNLIARGRVGLHPSSSTEGIDHLSGRTRLRTRSAFTQSLAIATDTGPAINEIRVIIMANAFFHPKMVDKLAMASVTETGMPMKIQTQARKMRNRLGFLIAKPIEQQSNTQLLPLVQPQSMQKQATTSLLRWPN